MNNPLRAHEHSEWRSAGYCHYLCAIVWKTGFCDFRVFQTPVSIGEPAAPHFVPTVLVRGYYISGHEAPQPVLRTIIFI